VPGEPAAVPQEHVAPEGTTRVACPEIQEAEEDSGAALSQGDASGGVQALELTCAPWAAAFEAIVVWTSLGPLPRWVPGPTTRWAPTIRLVPHGT
jgi:hypothetical protein